MKPIFILFAVTPFCVAPALASGASSAAWCLPSDAGALTSFACSSERLNRLFAERMSCTNDAACRSLLKLAGLRGKGGGFSEVLVKPEFPADLNEMEAKFALPKGELAVNWKRRESDVALNLAVPRDQSFAVEVPGGVSSQIVTGDLGYGRFAGKKMFAEVEASAAGGSVEMLFEGFGPKGHFHRSTRIRLSRHRKTCTAVAEIPSDLGLWRLHVRMGLSARKGEVARLENLRYGVDDGTYSARASDRRVYVEPKLLFRASFEESAKADFAAGSKEPVSMRGVTFEKGIVGKAARFSRVAGSALEYAAKGNVDARRGAVSFWFRGSKAGKACGRDQTLFAMRRADASNAVGTGAHELGWRGGRLTARLADDDDTRFGPDWYKYDERWHHVVFGWDEEGIHEYVDGEPWIGKVSAVSPLAAALQRAQPFVEYSKPATFSAFAIGGVTNAVFDGLIDEFKVWSAPLGPVAAKAECHAVHPPDTSDEHVRKLHGLRPGNPVESLAPAEIPGVIPADDLELVDEVKLDRAPSEKRYRAFGKTAVRKLGDVGYLEAGPSAGDRFAVGFEIDPKHPLYQIEIDYPDDAIRTMDIIAQRGRRGAECDYTMQCGIATGGEYANTGRILTHRVLFWPSKSDPHLAVVMMTCRSGAPAAASAIRVLRVKSGTLPPLAVNEPKGRDGWGRTFALYFEDPAIMYDFGFLMGEWNLAGGANRLVDRTAAVMKYTGQNLFAYPGIFYDGPIEWGRYNPRGETSRLLEAYYAKFDAEGLGVMPTVNWHDLELPDGFVTAAKFEDGSLNDTPIALFDTGKPNPGGWHATPPDFNVSHPDVRRQIVKAIDQLVSRGKGHPSFRGICLHLTPHALLWWGDETCGYNDYTVRAFSRATGIDVPIDAQDPLRAKSSADYLRAHAWSKWLGWRCGVVTSLYSEIAKRLRAARGDLKLWVNVYMDCGKPESEAVSDYVAQRLHRAGLDVKALSAAIPNLIVGHTRVPLGPRARPKCTYETDASYRLESTIFSRSDTWAAIRDAAFPFVGLHDSYLECPIGGGGALECAWFKEVPWRVSVINPSGRHALRHFVEPLRVQDVLGISKGGFLIGTYGIEKPVADFARAFRSLPPVVMRDVPGVGTAAVKVRRGSFDGRVYAYVVNTEDAPASIEFPLEGVWQNSVTERRIDGRSLLELMPYELMGLVQVADADRAAHDGIVSRVEAADREREVRQSRLTKRASLADYRMKVTKSGGTNVWTRALQAALEENEIVVIPAASEPYLIDGPVLIPSNRRIEAHGATVALLSETRTLMLRNANCRDGTLAPLSGKRDDNIAIVGGRWEDWTRCRAGYGRTGRFDMSERRQGNWYGVSTLFYFGSCDHVTVKDATFAHTSAFAVQSGDGDAHGYGGIVFDDCYADGLHLNGNLTRVHVSDVRGKVGDDLVALNAYDWLNSSVNFGPQKDILCEDLELLHKNGSGYPAIRLQPAKYRYGDGHVVDCSMSDVIFRKVRGIVTFKMYLQTPGYRIGTSPEWAEVGSGGNLWFEDIEIDLTHPIDTMGQYATSDPLRGHFGAFEFGANLTDVHFRNLDIRFHLDRWPLSHLAVVGPKSIRLGETEVFDPYVSCRVGRVTVEGLKLRGEKPSELVRATVFDDVNRDGRSSGKGVIDHLDIR